MFLELSIETILKLIKQSWLTDGREVLCPSLVSGASVFASSFVATGDVGSVPAGYTGTVVSIGTGGRVEGESKIRESSVFGLFGLGAIVLLVGIHENALVVGSFVILLDHSLELTNFLRVTNYRLTVDG